MSVLGPSGPPPLPPPVVSERDKSDGRIIRVIIVSVVIVIVGAAGAAISYWIHFSRKYANIDHSSETLSVTFDGKDTSTNYSNPKYGISLKLPGHWDRIGVNRNAFVGLADAPPRTSPRFLVMFQSAFTGVPVPIDSEASSIAGRYVGFQAVKLERIERTTIGGRDARVLHFTDDAHNRTFRIAVLENGPVAYILIILGPTDATARWQYLDSVLPQMIKVQ